MRWFAYVDNEDRWNLNSLFSSEEIKDQLRKLPSDFEAYASIQNYDAEATIQSCPLYIDVDSSSLYDAWETAKDTWCKLKSDFEIDPYLYFSGSKGFHIIMPLLIKHERCHKIAREIAEDYCIDLDKNVYTSRRMWRCNGTINRKTGNYKIRIPSIDIGLDDILDLSKNGEQERFIEHKFVYHKSNLFNDMVNAEISKFKEYKSTPIIYSEFKSLDPCILDMWKLDDIKEGTRHNILFILARSCVKGGDTFDEALSRFKNHSYWGKHYPWHKVKAVVNSAYRLKGVFWTCKGNSVDAEILRDYFVGKTCRWHKDFSFYTTDLNSNQSHETILGCSKIS